MAEYLEYEWQSRRFDSDSVPVTSSHQNKVVPGLKEAAEAVRNLIPTKPDIEFRRVDDEFIIRFLNARKYNILESFELMANYFAYRQKNVKLFEEMNVGNPLIRQALNDGFPGVLAERDRRGRCVLILFTSNWDHSAYPMLAIYQSLLLSLEKLIEIPRNQVNGFVVIVDWSQFSFRQSSSLNPRILKLMIEGLQDCFPARFKGIHFINQPWYVVAALAVIRPFLKEKTKEKIYLHGNNLSTLHDYVTKDILPAELGGEGPSYNPEIWVSQIADNSPIVKVVTTPKKLGHFVKSDTFHGSPSIQEKFKVLKINSAELLSDDGQSGNSSDEGGGT